MTGLRKLFRGTLGIAAVGTAAALVGSVGLSVAAGASPSKTKAKPVVLGIVYDGTGMNAPSDEGEGVALEAWEKWTNAHGGIGGRQVKLLVENDKSSPTTAVGGVREIAAAGAAALVPSYATAGTIKSSIDAAKIPAIGGIQDGLTWGTDPNYFATGTTPENYAASITWLGLPKNDKLGVFYSAANAEASVTLPLYKATFAVKGGTVVGNWGVTVTAATYAAQCLAAKSAGATEVLWNASPPTVLRVAPSCAAQGFKPQYVTSDQVLTGTWLKTPSLYGTLISFNNAPIYGSAKSFPGLKDYDAAMKKYESSWLKSPLYGQSTMSGWTAGLLFADAVKAAKVPANKVVTKTDVFKGLHKLHGDTLDGLSGPLTFPKTGKYQITCYFTGKVTKGKYVALGTKPTCPAKLTLSS